MVPKYGFIDLSGRIRIEAQFDLVGEFHFGLARVRLDNKYGYIDTAGRIKIEAKFDRADDFNQSFAAVAIKEKFGFINVKGEFIIEPKYNQVGIFQKINFATDIPASRLAAVRVEGKWGLIDENDKYAVKPVYEGLEGDLGLRNETKTVVVAQIDKDGLAMVKLQDDKSLVSVKFSCLVTEKPESAEIYRIEEYDFDETVRDTFIRPANQLPEGNTSTTGWLNKNKSWIIIFVYRPQNGKAQIKHLRCEPALNNTVTVNFP